MSCAPSKRELDRASNRPARATRLQSVIARTTIAAALVVAACTPAHLPGGEEPQGFCGDGRVNGDETCDDGNSTAGDGCSDVCQPEIPPNCGDGVFIPEEGEQCDDGNTESGDGCSFGCWIEGCGNNFLDVGEACEDGNNVAGDGCSADCKSDETCGNNIVDDAVGEVCDDGNGDDTDNCPASCEPARCGDGFVQKGIESCDDGNSAAGDGCTDCILDSCGNADLDDGEECDQGAANGSDNSSCFRTCLTTEVVMEPSFNQLANPNAVAGDEINSVEVGDLDGDGRADAVLMSTQDSTVTMLHGKGDGTLSGNRFLTGQFSGGTRSRFADVNGDGEDDLIVVSTSSLVHTLLGDGEGFTLFSSASTEIDVGGQSPRDLIVAELNGDSFLDVATVNRTSNDVTILIGDGAGNFTATARFGTQSGNGGNGPTSIALGDITGDGVADIVTANQISSDVALLTGLGGGNFAAPEIFSTVLGAQGTGPLQVVLADVTNDGKLDVLTANASSSDVTVLAQVGGSLATPLAFPTFDGDAGLSPRGLAVGDVNKDGVPDIVTTNTLDISVVPGLGAGVAFGPPQIHSGQISDEAVSLGTPLLADINGDNTLDVITANLSSPRDVRVFVGKGNGTFEAPEGFHIDIDRSNQSPAQLHVRDFDGDGRADVLALSSGAIVIMSGDGEGRLLPASLATAGGQDVALGDFDDDGDLDYFCGQNTSATLLLALQDQSRRLTPTSLGSPSTSFTIAADSGDFDGNGTVDVVGIAASQILFLSGDGAGAFTPFDPALATLTTNGRRVVVGDVSNDGDDDIVVAMIGSEVNVLIGDGAGAFTAPTPISTVVGAGGNSPLDVTIADVDGQMGGDIITINASQDFTVIRSTGSGTFAAAKVVPAVFGADPAGTVSVAAGDVNGDGHIDLVSANRERSTISIVIGFGNGNFAAPQTFPISAPTAVKVGDFDGDGRADVLVGTADTHAAIFLGKGHP